MQEAWEKKTEEYRINLTKFMIMLIDANYFNVELDGSRLTPVELITRLTDIIPTTIVHVESSANKIFSVGCNRSYTRKGYHLVEDLLANGLP